MPRREVKSHLICTGDFLDHDGQLREVESAVVEGIAVRVACTDGSDFLFAKGVPITVERPDPRATRYRVVDENPYLDREDAWDDLTLDEAASRIEDLYPVEAAEVIADVEDGVDWPVRFTDDETGREVTLSKAVS